MSKITIGQIEAAYDKGVAVHLGKIRFSEAVESLRIDYAMNAASAADYVGNVGNLLNGKVYKRTFNLIAANYFLSRIAKEFPESSLSAAISAIKLHIEYYQSVSKTKLPQLTALCERYLTSGVLKPVELTKFSAEFDEEIEHALLMSTQQRRERSQNYPKKPNSVLVLASAFVRNPYVKAEVLIRSKGVCEACRNVGPFVRKTNGERYLEVHHKIPLAEGGDDTVENAMALCPNCHREAHLGVDSAKFRTVNP